MKSEELIELAKRARTFSCSEISKFKVGAALLTNDGKIFSGCNIEDPSGIGLTNICAVIKALSEGYKDFVKIAVVGGTDKLVSCTPCGICRQYLNSFSPQIKIICLDNNCVKEYTLNELLPYTFNEKFNN